MNDDELGYELCRELEDELWYKLDMIYITSRGLSREHELGAK